MAVLIALFALAQAPRAQQPDISVISPAFFFCAFIVVLCQPWHGHGNAVSSEMSRVGVRLVLLLRNLSFFL